MPNLVMYMPYAYYLFYKPFQVMCQFSPEGDKRTLADFFKGIARDIYPAGRLDYDSEGLLLLTNDKQLNHRLLNPLFVHEREYWVQVEGTPAEEALAQLRNGTTITVDGKPYRTRPAKARLLQHVTVPDRNPPIRYRANIPATWLSLSLTEGKNRQVRRMTAAAGHPTLRLIRYRIGNVTLGDMQPGDYLQAGPEIIPRLFGKQ